MPCIGSALLIFVANSSNAFGKALSTSPVVLVGKMSYSLYLWHWPILAFLHYRYENTLNISDYAAALVITFALSYLSWKYIETPLRRPNFLSRRQVFAFAIVGVSVFFTVGTYMKITDGMPNRFDSETLLLERSAMSVNPLRKKCHSSDQFSQAEKPECLIGDKSKADMSAIIWGDSHADSMSPAISRLLSEKGLKGFQATKSSCPPFFPGYTWRGREVESCKKYNDDVLRYVLKTESIKHIFLHARWGAVTDISAEGEKPDETSFYQALETLASELNAIGKRVYIIGPTPLAKFNVPRCLSKQSAFKDKNTYLCHAFPLRKAWPSSKKLWNLSKNYQKKENTPYSCHMRNYVGKASV
jgi:hypothetical protein